MEKNMKLVKSVLVILILNFLVHAQTYTPPAESESIVGKNFFKNAKPLDEQYRSQFDDCDKRNFFNGVDMTQFRFRNCDTPDRKGDPNKLRALLKFSNGTIFFESKMSIDIDGSWKACCEKPGKTDLCATAYNFKPDIEGEAACDSYKREKFVDPDIYPYIVIPTTTPKGLPNREKQAKEFRYRTKVGMGDVGIVIYKDKMIPVFVADGGPHNKMGEGSPALFKELGQTWCREFNNENRCIKYRNSSLPKEVLYLIFPNSKIPNFNSKTPFERLRLVKEVAEAKFNELRLLR